MNYISTYNVGIDAVIKSVQTSLYDYLIVRWVNKLNGYGRVYKTEDSNGRITPKWHISKGDYTDVFFDDNFSGTFFFMDNETHDTDDELVYKAKVKVVCMVNLKEILNDATGRPDETARRDVIELLRSISKNRFKITGIEKGIDTVFSGVNTTSIKTANMNPLHVFAITLDLFYYLTDKCN